MDFRLEMKLEAANKSIAHDDKIFLIGSCFTENLGAKLSAHKFAVQQNPNGILFNPISIASALKSYAKNKVVCENDLFYLNEAFHSWDHHSRFSAPVAAEALKKINGSTGEAHHFLSSANVVIITMGSAWVYELSGEAVNPALVEIAANNHKAPASWFRKKLMTTAELKETLSDIVSTVKSISTNCIILFTVSPVRHLREGFVENNRSKARLITAVHDLIEVSENVHYFPAYELVIDDLRDYRFFAEDLVHPNYAATNYVWEKFSQHYFSERTQLLLADINRINAAIAHKPFNPKSVAHGAFKKRTLELLEKISIENPHIDFASERLFLH